MLPRSLDKELMGLSGAFSSHPHPPVPPLSKMISDGLMSCSAATNNQTGEGVAIKKVTNVFSKKILAKRALREIKLLQHFRGHRNVCIYFFHPDRSGEIEREL